MKHTPPEWNQLEQRLRREPASPPPPADAVPNLLCAVRMAAPAPSAPPAAPRSSVWWLGAAAAVTLALVLAVQGPAPTPPPPVAAAPAISQAAADWSLAALDAAAAAPLQQEWDGLQRDLQAMAGHVVNCLPAAGAWTPRG
jgi:hypothetical protein